MFGCLNICSLGNKLDDLLDVRRDQSLDVMCLVETWHDSDSVSLRRLRVDGMQVIDRPRPRTVSDTLATNHGGVAIVAMPGIRLTRSDIGARPVTFEHVCARVASGSSACIAVVIYRPPSAAASATFFDELSDLLDRLAIIVEPVYVVGDFNIRSDRPDDPTTVQFNETLAAYGLANRVTVQTHARGGSLDVVITRLDLPTPSVDVIDAGLSDHDLVRWSAPLVRPHPVYVTAMSRPWKRLNVSAFRTALQASPLCHGIQTPGGTQCRRPC